jgi:GWxTD domain-containing protein
MRLITACIIMTCVLVAFGVPPCEGGERCGPFPVWSTGDLDFGVDVLCFREEDERCLVQISCSISNDQLRFVEAETGEGQGGLEILVSFRDEEGREADSAKRRLELTARSMIQAEKRDVIQVVQVDRYLLPGRYEMKVKISDLNAPKVGIWYAIRGIKQSGEVRQEVVVPDLHGQALVLSDIAFARSIRPDSVGGEFSRAGLEIIPNPTHIYGLRLAELPVYLEVYDGREAESVDTLLTEYVIRDRRGKRILGQTLALAPGDRRWWPRAFAISLVGVPQGSYELEVTVQDPESMESVSMVACFDVMWSMLSWDRSLQEGLEELSLILTEEELAAVDQLAPGDRERYMRAYWKRLDPTPDTIQNEALQEYYRRLKFANEHYRAYRKGMFTDQGRIYVKYGPADDVRQDSAWGSNPGASDVLYPGATHQTGSSGHRRVDETGMTFREMGIDETDREAARLGNVQVVGKSFEVWVYDSGGKPLSGNWALTGSGKKMKFVFVDQRGYGDMDLIYSSEGEDY